MGRVFGDLAVIRGIVYYTIAPHEIRAFGGALKYGLPNMVPRVFASLWTYLPVFIAGYSIYVGVDDLHRRMLRKNPKLYVNEVNPNPPPPPPPPPPPEKCAKKH